MSNDSLFRSDTSESHPSTAAATGFVTLFLLTLFLVSAVIRGTLLTNIGYSAGEVLSEKLQHLRDHGQNYNVVFLGTSHVYRGIEPEVFDRTVSKSGFNVKSCNAGVFRLGTLEAKLIIDTLLKDRPAGNPLLIILEPSLRDFDIVNWSTERELFTHSFEGTKSAVRFHWTGILDRQSASLRARHIVAMLSDLASGLMYSLNYGRASAAAFPDGASFSIRTYLIPPENGFVPLDDEKLARHSGRTGSEMSDKAFSDSLESGIEERRRLTRLPMASAIRLYEQFVEDIEASGGRVAFLATPRISAGTPRIGDDIESLLKHPPKFLSDRLVGDYRYSSDDSIDEIFEARYWFDPEHLNRDGAELFTECLAVDLMQKHSSLLPR